MSVFSHRWLLVAVMTLSIAGGPAFAQGLTAVTGVVSDPTGAVIPGVEVTVTNSATGVTRTAITNEAGFYSITQLPPGTYSVRAELAGFKATQVSSVPLPVNETVSLSLKLEIGALTDVVDVVASADVVNTTNAQLGVAFDEKKIIDLPLNARNIVGLLSLQAGVTVSDKSGEFDRDDGGQVNGARNDQQNIVLDGVNINAQERGAALEGALPTTLDSVQEFIVQTAGQSGGAGRGSGAQVQLVTKSGSNEWHGSLYEFYRTTGTSAANYFGPVDPVTRKRKAAPLIRHLPGGSFGGPIVKDKFFIFGAYEHHSDRSATLETRTVPTPEFLNGQVRYQRRDGTFGTITDGPGGMLEQWTGIPGDRWNPNLIGPNGIYERYRPFSTAPGTQPSTDNGANLLTYRFNAPFKRDRNIYISRTDYNINTTNILYFRGTLNDDVRTLAAESFPGFNNPRERIDNSKGFALNWNSSFSSSLNSNLSFGLTRESFEDTGNQTPNYSAPRFSNLIQTTGSQRQAINTWNIAESLSWVRGNHSLEFGFNYRFIDNKLRSFAIVGLPSYGGSANLTGNDIGAAGSPGLRRALGDTEFGRVADPGIVGDAVMAATGSLSRFTEDVQFDFRGNRLPPGSPFVRNYGLQEYDYFIQDSWRMKPNLTLTYGLHYAYQTPPYERDGVQVNWTENLGQRWREMRDTNKDASAFPLLTVQLAGRANGLPDFYTPDTNNFAPRASVAWSPGIGWMNKGGQTVVRAGYALTYDRIGGRFARDAATSGSIGLVMANAVPGYAFSIDGLNGIPRAPRIGTGGNLPRENFPSITAPTFTMPTHPGGYPGVSAAGIDSGLHSPQNHLVNLTISKELPGGWVVESSYVGRFARNLLGQVDIASPPNIRDAASGQSWYEATAALFTAMQNGTPVNSLQAIPWFENQYSIGKAEIERRLNRTFPNMTQAWYAYITRNRPLGPNTPVSQFDQIGELEAAIRTRKLSNGQVQFFGLFGNFSKSNYHSGQFSVRRRFAQGFTVAMNYTLSKSMDITSAAEARGNRANGTTGEGLAADALNPDLSYALSDFDRRHQFNGNFTVDLPFGREKLIGSNVPPAINHIIGGWQLSGIAVMTSGRPWNFTASSRFNHHWFGRDQPHVTQPLPFQLTKLNGRPFLIGKDAAEREQHRRESFKNSFPGGPIARNQGRGPAFHNLDVAISKAIDLSAVNEGMRLRFRGETFNAMNHPNFGIPTTEAGHNIDRGGGTLGEVTTTQGTERVMQFSIRLEW